MSSSLPPTTRFSVTVVGAGITGLAVGLRLAQQGHDVRIIERRKEGFAATSVGNRTYSKCDADHRSDGVEGSVCGD